MRERGDGRREVQYIQYSATEQRENVQAKGIYCAFFYLIFLKAVGNEKEGGQEGAKCSQ